jgi:hypothetical protein
MTLEELRAAFEELEDEFLKFKRVKNPPTKRHDLCAFMLLDQLLPEGHEMLGAAGHDEVWLNIDPEKLAPVITKEQILTLVRCGIRYSDSDSSLCMFV